ncbi:MAG TPA: asparagine synthetase B family protein [Chloroflexi bacterium]|nr:asparagine synthetase B family protein [Chloroflexota bacterium]
MPEGTERHGFVITFGHDAGKVGAGEAVHYVPGPAAWTEAKAPHAQAWCYGELLSYRGDGSTSECLERFLADHGAGRASYSDLNGRFVLLILDRAGKEWEIVTDRMGAMHAYWLRRGERVEMIGSDLAAVARRGSQRELDWEGIASFFALGFFIDDLTIYRDVQILEPASVYRISPDGRLLQYTRYFRWHHTIDRARSYDETIEAYDALLRKAVRRATAHGRAILPISGGLDSRSLAMVLPEGPATQAYSYGYSPDSVETRIAAQVARARGFSFTAHTIRPYLFDRLPEIVLTLHGCQDVTMARQMSVNAWVRERADAVLTGLWGDVWHDQMGLADGVPPGVSIAGHVMHKMAKRGRGWLLEHVCRPRLGEQEIEKVLEARIAEGLRSFGDIEDPDWRVKAYKNTHWAFRWSNASLRGFEVGARPRIPYYDTDLIDFFCTVPTAYVRDRRLQVDHLKRYAPDLARIRWQQAEANLYLARYGYWVSLPRRAFQRLRWAFRGQQALQRNWEVQLLSPEGRAGLEEWLLREGLTLHEFVSPETIRELVEGFYARPGAANGYTVSMLLTFSAWLEVMT